MFNHIHGHSHYSLLQAIGDIKPIAKKIKSLGQEVMPLTDYNSMYGSIQHYEVAKKEGLKPLIGVELCTHVVKDGKTEKPYYSILFAKNYEGYLRLLEIVSEAHTQSSASIPYFPFEKIRDKAENIVVVMGGEASHINYLLQQGEPEKKIAELIQMYSSYFPAGQFFLEVTAQSYMNVPHYKKINTAIITLSKQLEIPCVVDNNFHYILPSDKDACDIASCIKDGKQYYEHGRKKKEGEWHIMSEDEIVETLIHNGYQHDQIHEWIANNQKLIDSIDVTIPLHQLLFPIYESPENITELYQHFQQLA